MRQQEFNERTGIVVSPEEFEKIHELYMAAGDMDKDGFCKEFRAHGHSALVSALFGSHQNLEEQRSDLAAKNKELTKQLEVAVELLIRKGAEYDDTRLTQTARNMVGRRKAILLSLHGGIRIGNDDLSYIEQHLS